MPGFERVGVNRHLEMGRGGEKGNTAAPIVTVRARNMSGGALARGDTVVWDTTNSSADLLAVTTTTSSGDRAALGMAFEAIGASATGRVQTWGPTDALKVDGTIDIAKGDLLSTAAAAKIAQKTTGAGAFARAMEAYATDDANGVIDAFLFGGFGVIPGA